MVSRAALFFRWFRLHGVYIIYSPNGRVTHVGRTVRGKRGLRQRLNNHLHGASSFVYLMHGAGRSRLSR